MAIYHLSVKTISRSQGRSSTAAAAYRSGEKITDERTGEIHDYTRKSDVLYSELILPSGEQANRAEFWNSIEKHHKRGDAVLVREVEIALPTELTPEQRKQLALSFAKELAERYSVAADISLHAPHKLTNRDLKNNPDQHHEIDPETGKKHNGNWHAHIMLSACHVAHDGTLGKKAVELDPIHCQRAKIENMADRERVRWTELSNAALEKAGHDARIDHRTLKAQGIDREPSKHLGVEATNYERRTGDKSNKRLDFEQQAAERLKAVTEIKELEREVQQLEQKINETKAEAVPLKMARGNQAWNSYHDKKAQEAIERERVEQEKRQKELEKLEKQRKRDKEFDEKWERNLREARERRELQEELEREKRRTPAEWEKIANDELVKIFVAERGEWRKGENKRLLDEAEAMRTQAWALKAQEPSGLGGLFVTKKREKWEADLQRKIDQHRALKQQAQDAIDGKSPNEREQIRRIEDKAREVFKEKHPKLAQVLIDKAAREQVEREEKQREQAKISEQKRQAQAQKSKQNSRDWDMER